MGKDSNDVWDAFAKWEEKRKLYPFQYMTDGGPRPDTLGAEYHHFIRIPVPHTTLAFWGFENEVVWKLFKANYGPFITQERYDNGAE